MAKVLLIQPNRNRTNKSDTLSVPPLSLIYLATAIKKKHEVKIYDRNLYKEDAILLKLLENYMPEIIGFTSMTSEMLLDIIHLGPIIKNKLKKAIIIVGGTHASVEPDSVLNEPYVDYIIRGEGEAALLEFCDTFDKNPKKLKTLKNVNKNPVRPLINLNEWDNPDFSLVNVTSSLS